MNNHFLCALQPLFLKPLHYPGEVLFTHHSPLVDRTISFRSMEIEKDLDMIHDWVNREYALAYWQLDGSRQRVYDLYYSIQRNSNGHSYIGLLDGEPICQFDVYRVLADEIRQYITADENDCGFHLLMAPNNRPIPNLSVAITQSFLLYYFSFPQAVRMFAEPDIHNQRSNRILQRAGFQFLHGIRMSYKTANLYSITKQQFHETYPVA
jgi:RimJ/RimL family protein N-acetyltransferase